MKDGERQVSIEVETGSVELADFCGGQLVYFSQRCPTREDSPNEDAGFAIQLGANHGLLAVADGVGGANCGNRASRAAIERLIAELDGSDKVSQSCRSEILDAIESSNVEILDWGIGAGSTLAVVELLNGSIRSFHIGDAKVLLVSNRGRIKFTTIGHAPVAIAVDLGMLNEDEALQHDDRNLITNCLGSREMKIEIGPTLDLAPRDTLVIASDGLFDNMTTEEIAVVIRAGDLAEKSAEIVDTVSARMNRSSADIDQSTPSKPDDLTMYFFRPAK